MLRLWLPDEEDRIMKKVLSIVLCFALVAALCACGKKMPEPEEPAVGMPNPMHEATQESILESLGFNFQIPAGAEDVSFYTIDGDPQIAQMKFTFDGDSYCYRMAATAEYKDIAGMYYEWANEEKAEVSYNEANCLWNDFEAGVILWYDIVPGIMYSLSQDSNATFDTLTIMANSLYEPLQGEADGVDDSFSAALNGVLADLQENYHGATAGCSLRGTAFACQLMDLFTEDAPSPDEVKSAVSGFAASLDSADKAEFTNQMSDVAAYVKEVLNNPDMVDGCGYEPFYAPYDASAMTPYIEALTAG